MIAVISSRSGDSMTGDDMENATISDLNLANAVPLCGKAANHVAEATKALIAASDDTIESAIAQLDLALSCLRRC